MLITSNYDDMENAETVSHIPSFWVAQYLFIFDIDYYLKLS